MNIRVAQSSDLQVLAALYRACFAEAPWYEDFSVAEVMADFEAMLAWTECIFLVATDDQGRPLGAYIAYDLVRKSDIATLLRVTDAGQMIYLAEMFVSLMHRVSGIATRLSEAALVCAKELGYEQAACRTSEYQNIVLDLYELRFQFVRAATQDVTSRKIIGGQEVICADRRVILTGSTTVPRPVVEPCR